MCREDSAPSTTCSKKWKRAAGFAGATLWPSWARHSLRCRRRWTCCGSCARRLPMSGRSLCNWRRQTRQIPYGSVLRWPDLPVAGEDAESAPRVLTRAAYAEVILRNGRLVAWLRRANPNLLVFLPADEPERSQTAAGLAHFLCAQGRERMRASSHGGALITTINGQPVAASFMARFLMDAWISPRAAGNASAEDSGDNGTRATGGPGASIGSPGGVRYCRSVPCSTPLPHPPGMLWINYSFCGGWCW